MELSSKIDREKKIFILHVTGEYRRPGDGYEAQRFVIKSFPEHGCRRVLLDLTEAIVMAGTLPAYETANPEPDVARELKKFSFAALYRQITVDERFFEDTAVNRGLRVRVFDNLDKAMEWLEQERKTHHNETDAK